MSPGLIVGIVLLVALVVAMYFIWRQNPSAPRRRNRVIDDD